MVEVDVLTPIAPGETIPEPVLRALEKQGSVRLTHYIIESPLPLPNERRAGTIARARNRAKRYGRADYVFFLDRDVILPPRGIERLLFALAFNPGYGAVGINYQDPVSGPAVHVAMGAVLFTRSVLDRITFRIEPNRCECLCCCLDLRRMGFGIDYLPGLRAHHLNPAYRPSEHRCGLSHSA